LHYNDVTNVGAIFMQESQIKSKITGALREFVELDLRRSYLVIGGMILVGIIVNIFVTKGWTVWPFIGAASVLVVISEAAQRNGQGVPPLQVYGFFFGAVAVWIIIVLVLSVLNPFIVLAATGALGFYAAKGGITEYQRRAKIDALRKAGRCIHCGELYDPKSEICENCGDEANPEDTRLARVAAVARQNRNPAKARAALNQPPAGASAKQKEQALLARARQSRPGRKK
jgi:hypothetical protein